MIEIALSGIFGLLVGWFGQRWYLFRNTVPKITGSKSRYLVQLIKPTANGEFSKLVYIGDDLVAAKEAYKSIRIPPRCRVDFLTDNNHTASRSA